MTEAHRNAWYAKDDQKFFKASARGDEGCLLIFFDDRTPQDLANDVNTAVNIALDLKRRWLLTEDNRQRVQGGLLPSDIAIGINIGRAYVNAADARPEGYAINLTKRIEGASRQGRYTHVFLSEAARGQLDHFTEETTYTFGPAVDIDAKGISREIRAFEVRHHFLPTDWNDLRGLPPRARAINSKPDAGHVELARRAYEQNPTNLWLAEEYIMLDMRFQDAEHRQASKVPARIPLKTRYEQAARVARRLCSSDHRDAGVLTIAGFIAGEYEDYDEEQRYYREALSIDDRYPEAHWYLAYSMSLQIFSELKAEGKGKMPRSSLDERRRARIEETLAAFERAVSLDPLNSWMWFDLGCERARWRETEEDLARAIEALCRAVKLNPTVKSHMSRSEPYLDETILNDPRLRACTGSADTN